MKWRGRRQSSNVEDRRGSGGGRRITGGKGGKFGIGTIVIIAVMYFMGASPTDIISQLVGGSSQTQTTQQSGSTQLSKKDKELGQFVSVVLQDTEDVWNKIFREQYNTDYPEPTLVLFTGSVQSACGTGSAAMGPFYCSGDDRLYIDLSFYQELKNKFNAPGDFAMAYVVAHEVAHHIQNKMGITTKVHKAKRKLSEAEGNKLSVKLELQADFLAGVWAHYAQGKGLLDAGDIDEALTAAHAIGDDAIQKKARGYVVPDSFTHGTSEQRMYWFKKGLRTGDIRQGDTFSQIQ